MYNISVYHCKANYRLSETTTTTI